MPNIIQIDDSFDGLALNATLHGRVPPVTNTGSAWAVDGLSTNITGGGNGDIKFANGGNVCKLRASGTDLAVQIDLRPTVNVDEFYSIFLRDTTTGVYPARGYILNIHPFANTTSGYYHMATSSSYNLTYIEQNKPWIYNVGVNTIALEAIDTNFRIIINGIVASSFSNATVSYNVNATRTGIICNNPGAGGGRVERFTVYDSIDLSPAPEYPVVFFG